jgi:hypothetical protein
VAGEAPNITPMHTDAQGDPEGDEANDGDVSSPRDTGSYAPDASSSSASGDAAEVPETSSPLPTSDGAVDPTHDTGGGSVDAVSQVVDAGPEVQQPRAVPDEPGSLEEAGLYADFRNRILSPDVEPYAPAFALWSDGATKQRYVHLPSGSRIDVSDPDHWVFPIGTRFYKTFIVGGRLIETRMLQKTSATTWFRATYAWSEDASRTTRARDGVSDVFGTGYDIPEEGSCPKCHDGAVDTVLGFEAVSLGNPGATGLTLAALEAGGHLSSALPASYPLPGDAATAAALGYLHANCGNACHNGTANADAAFTGFRMRLLTTSLRAPADTDTFRTGVGVASSFQPSPSANLLRIAPGNSAGSAVVYRDGTRGSSDQMPPIDTLRVDPTGLSTVRAFIDALPP